MKANQVQAMIAINAARITDIHDEIDYAKAIAKAHAVAGEKAFAGEAYAHASQKTRSLAKAVKLQREMKDELATLHARAKRGVAYEKAFGFYPTEALLATMELDAALAIAETYIEITDGPIV